MIIGMKPIELSETIEGLPNTNLLTDANLIASMQLEQIAGNIVNFASIKRFKDYIKNSLIGYDKENDEIIVANPNEDYTYLFQVETKTWSVIGKKFTGLVNYYPELYGICGNDGEEGVYSFSSELFTPVKGVVITRPTQFENQGAYKKLYHSIIRGALNINPGKYLGVYLYASNDLKKWQLMTGNDRELGSIYDPEIGIAHTTAKHFCFVIISDLVLIEDDLELDNFLSHIECEVEIKWSNKLH